MPNSLICLRLRARGYSPWAPAAVFGTVTPWPPGRASKRLAQPGVLALARARSPSPQNAPATARGRTGPKALLRARAPRGRESLSLPGRRGGILTPFPFPRARQDARLGPANSRPTAVTRKPSPRRHSDARPNMLLAPRSARPRAPRAVAGHASPPGGRPPTPPLPRPGPGKEGASPAHPPRPSILGPRPFGW